jgi:hypothetical protein
LLSQQIKSLREELRNLESKDAVKNEWLERFRKHRDIESLNRQLVTELIDTIYVHDGRRITIKFKFRDEFEQIAEFMKRESETESPKTAV